MTGALLLLPLGAFGCGEPGDGSLGVPVATTTAGFEGTTGIAEASTGASRSSGNEYIPCDGHEDCDGISCFEGVCLPCEGREERCADDELCIDERCRPLVDLDACQTAGVATCGDGILQAPELCDGGPGCEGCERTVNAQPWGEPADMFALDVAPDGTVAGLSWSSTGARLHLIGPGGSTRLIRVLGPSMSGLRWVEDQLFIWGTDLGTVVMGVDRSGDERWTRSFPEAQLGGGRARLDGLVLAGSVAQDNSPSPRGIVVVVGPDGEALLEAKQGDLRSVDAVAAVEDELVFAGQPLDHEDRTLVRRLDASGASRWTDAGFGRTFSPVIVMADGSSAWSITANGTAVQHDADGQRVQTVPCLGSVNGWVDSTAAGVSTALEFQARTPSGDDFWWVLAGPPTDERRAWVTTHEVRTMAWTPRGSLLVALHGVPTLMEVSL